nr:MAG TPA: hypothetical protein [Caudoviricetes sp.]
MTTSSYGRIETSLIYVMYYLPHLVSTSSSESHPSPATN